MKKCIFVRVGRKGIKRIKDLAQKQVNSHNRARKTKRFIVKYRASLSVLRYAGYAPYVAQGEMMKYISLICLVLSSILMLRTVAYAESDSLCRMTKNRSIAFASHTADDTFNVTISGGPCQKAALSITVSNKDGDILYDYRAPFMQHVVIHGENLSLHEAATRFVKTALDSANWGNSSALPQWKPEFQFYDENSTSIAADKKTYQSFRERDLPVLWHQTYYEGWRHIVYDRENKKAVVLLDGGL